MKTFGVIFSRGMSEDLMELEDYIALKTTSETAENYIDGLIVECKSFRLAPYRGSKRRELRPNMRVTGYKRAISIVFRTEEDQKLVVFLGVSYRGRSIAQILARNE
jgi:toxin ParE1/3/4